MTNGFALIDRKTKKVVWVGTKKPKKSLAGNWKVYLTLPNFHPYTYVLLVANKFILIPISIHPKKTKKKKV